MTKEEIDRLSEEVTVLHNSVADVALLYIEGNASKDDLEGAVNDWKAACQNLGMAMTRKK